MKKKVMLVILAAVLSLAGTVRSQAAETSFYGYTWLRYSAIDTWKYNDGSFWTSTNSFEIPRCYIRLKTKFSDMISGQVTLDINNSSAAQSYVTTTTAGTVTAQTTVADWRMYVKYAYADFAGLIPDAVIRVGMQKVYFGTIDLWEYPVIQKEIVDLAGLLSSADQGIAIDGNIPGGWGDYQVALYNGSGYAKMETNPKKAGCVSATIVPFPGIWLRGSYYGDITTTGATDTQVDKLRSSAVLGFNFFPVNGHLEYIIPFNPKTGEQGSAAELFLQSKIPFDIAVLKNMDLVFRADYYKVNVDKKGTSANASDAGWIIAGFNYKAAEGLNLQFNAENKVFEKTGLHTMTYTAQTVLSW